MAVDKQRHGCLTTWLVFMVLVNGGVAFFYLLGSAAAAPGIPGWATPLLGVLCLANVAFAVGLWKWKKWGFWGFTATAAVAFVVNLIIGVGIVPALLGFVGIAILYWVLQMGGDKKAWTRLE